MFFFIRILYHLFLCTFILIPLILCTNDKLQDQLIHHYSSPPHFPAHHQYSGGMGVFSFSLSFNSENPGVVPKKKDPKCGSEQRCIPFSRTYIVR
jgi:hypothetical protein